ncbi:MAG: N-acetylmuramoyl-L-alanine amidase [Saprospiraceae bacterium]|nr:N-acetylmuramoyl-L-alanine amidase [Saprospiraceae bacterium]MCB9343706.1 N-acetylmuramoyl-L-alanine amidase [Lewinellaceae bacterium]
MTFFWKIMRIPINLLITTFLLIQLTPSSAQKSDWKENYLTAAPKPGDNTLDFLSRYLLADFDCNIDLFCRINKVSTDSKLNVEDLYKLPICVATYNGKTIRSTLGIKDWQQAVRIKSFNEAAHKDGLRPEDFIEDKSLWVPFHEIECPDVADKTPPKQIVRKGNTPSAKITSFYGEDGLNSGSRIYPIFGTKYQKTPLIDNRLKDKVFYLISGHGGPDVGAQGKRAGNVLCEDEYAYDVTLRLLRLLLSHGATAYMIVRDPDDGIRDEAYLKSDTDETVWENMVIPYDQKERLKQRTDFINEVTQKHLKNGVTDQTIIEIHVDSRTHDKEIDVFFYYRPGSEESQDLANTLYKTFKQKYMSLRGSRGYEGTVRSRELFTLKETIAPKAVYIELANIKNDWDQQRLVIKNNRQALANWLYQGIVKNAK